MLIARFRGQSALARADGYQGLRVVADMDWLLPEPPAIEAIVSYELLLDRLAASPTFAAVFAAAAADGDCVVDVAGLHVDVAGMRAIADVARAAQADVQLRGAFSAFRRYWRLSGFDEAAPMVQLVA